MISSLNGFMTYHHSIHYRLSFLISFIYNQCIRHQGSSIDATPLMKALHSHCLSYYSLMGMLRTKKLYVLLFTSCLLDLVRALVKKMGFNCSVVSIFNSDFAPFASVMNYFLSVTYVIKFG